jgi:hypothetical protein
MEPCLTIWYAKIHRQYEGSCLTRTMVVSVAKDSRQVAKMLFVDKLSQSRAAELAISWLGYDCSIQTTRARNS